MRSKKHTKWHVPFIPFVPVGTCVFVTLVFLFLCRSCSVRAAAKLGSGLSGSSVADISLCVLSKTQWKRTDALSAATVQKLNEISLLLTSQQQGDRGGGEGRGGSGGHVLHPAASAITQEDKKPDRRKEEREECEKIQKRKGKMYKYDSAFTLWFSYFVYFVHFWQIT